MQINISVAHLIEIARFGIVGVAATAIHFSIALGLATFAHWPLLVANIVAWIVAFCASYAGHYHFTFNHSGSHKTSMTRHLCVSLSGLALSLALLKGMLYFGLGNDATKLAVSILIIPVFTYFLSKRWSFAAR